MISTGASRGSSAGGFEYISQGGQADEISRNQLLGDTPQELDKEFKSYADNHDRLQNNQLNILLSPDGNQQDFSNEEFREMVENHLHNLKLENHPHIAYVHRNTENPHVHILVSRVNQDNQVYKDNFISKRCQQSAERLAKEYGLQTAREVSKSFKAELGLSIRVQLRESVSLEQLNKRLSNKDIRVEAVYKTNGKDIQGYRVHAGERSFKLSEVDRNLSKTLGKQLETNHGIVKEAISKTLSRGGNDKALEIISKGIGKPLSKGANLASDITKAISSVSNPVSLSLSVVKAATHIISRGMDRGGMEW